MKFTRKEFKEPIETKIQKWNIARNVKHELGLRRIPRYKRVGIDYETVQTVIKPKHKEKSMLFLNEKYKDGCVIILNNDDYLKLNDDDPTDSLIKKRLGSNENVSSIIFVNERGVCKDLLPLIQKYNWIPLEKLKNNNSGNLDWRGHYAVVIRGGIQNPTEIGKIQLFNMDYDFASKKTTELIEGQLTFLMLKADNATDLLRNSNSYDKIYEKYDKFCNENGLLDRNRLIEKKILDQNDSLICPICGKNISANELLGNCRKSDEIELLHLIPLKSGEDNHCPYNLGLGCHMCNVFQGENTIEETIERARQIVTFHDE